MNDSSHVRRILARDIHGDPSVQMNDSSFAKRILARVIHETKEILRYHRINDISGSWRILARDILENTDNHPTSIIMTVVVTQSGMVYPVEVSTTIVDAE